MRLNRGWVYWHEGKEDAAQRDFAAVLEAPPEKRLPEAAYYRGRLRWQQRRYGEALEDFDRVAAEKPDFRPALRFRALVHLAEGEERRALADLNAYLGDRQPFDTQSRPACERRGRLLSALATELPPNRQPAARRLALADLRRAADLGGKSPSLFRVLGADLERLGNPEGALAAYTRGLKLTPGDLRLRIQRGWAYLAFNQPEKARQDFAAAARQAPDNAEAHAGLGYLDATSKAAARARREAELALLHGGGNYLVLHNVACIHAALAAQGGDDARGQEDLTLALLRRAVELWKRGGRGPNEIELIKKEPAFGLVLRRPELRQFLTEQASAAGR